MTTQDQARTAIRELVEKFRATPTKQRASYNEQQTREYFILPLFRALGWDTESPAEVTAEEQISRGFVDFGFYLDGVPRFYLETKKIPEDLGKRQWATQAINYAYLKGVTWAVLSDFEGLKVFNAEWEESNPQRAIFLDLSWEHYADSDFERLWLLSKTAIREGEIDRLAESVGKKSRKRPVTEQLFAQLTQWRHELFKEILGWDKTLWSNDPRAIDNAVQRLLDRLIFIRTVEDRGIEAPRLHAVIRQYKASRARGKNLFHDLQTLFRELDDIYNARLFAESTVDHVEIHNPDLLTSIIDGLYESPGGYISYNFNAIDADVLGNIYEQYLGFKALDPEGQQAIDLGKRQKRKAQGIYYTPQFVVRYIVQNTLGKLLEEGADPHQIRVLDPACGSGSFLIEAFDVLDRWLAQHGTAQDRESPRTRRLRILQENIYGVDLDEQAVEVARLNLLLRATGERGRLPMLEHIKRGNSLIDDPAVAGDAAFKWEEEFPEVFADGGFDVVVGNPPYVRIQRIGHLQSDFLYANYATPASKTDLSQLFLERSLTLVKKSGFAGLICTSQWMATDYGRNMRELLSDGTLHEIVDFGSLPVFQEASTYPAIYILSSTRTDLLKLRKLVSVEQLNLQGIEEIEPRLIDPRRLGSSPWNLASLDIASVIQERGIKCVPLSAFGQAYIGTLTGMDAAFVVEETTAKRKQLEADLLLPYAYRGAEVGRYLLTRPGSFVIYPYSEGSSGTPQLISEEQLRKVYPAVYEHLLSHKADLRERKDSRRYYARGDDWYRHLRPGSFDYIHPEKLIVKGIDTKSVVGLLGSETAFNGANCPGIILSNMQRHSTAYILGILNSSVITYHLRAVCPPKLGGYTRFNATNINETPIRFIDFSDPVEVAQHDRIVSLVEQMFDLRPKYALAEAAFDDSRHDLARKIERLDAEIDALVYELYGLTDEEIAIVEGRA